MKLLKMTWIGLTGLVLLGTHSFVYACDHAAKASETAEATPCKAVRTLVVTADGRAAVESAPVMSFEIDVPGRTTPRYVRIVACEKTEPATHSVARTARAAMTIGRALVTTVEAVVGSLLNAAAGRTASLV